RDFHVTGVQTCALPIYKASQHKLIEKSLLTLQNLPTPRFIGYVHPHRGRSADGLPLRTAQQMESLLAQHDGEIVCFKLVEGWGAIGRASCRGRVERQAG